MAIPSVTLRLGESRLCTMDFSALLARGETLSSVTSVAVDLTTVPALVVGAPSCSGVLAQFRISGGLQDRKYKITVYCVTSAGNTIEGEGYLQCRGPLSFTVTPAAGGVGAAGH